MMNLISIILPFVLSNFSHAQQIKVEVPDYQAAVVNTTLSAIFAQKGIELPTSAPENKFIYFNQNFGAHLFFTNVILNNINSEVVVQKIKKTEYCETKLGTQVKSTYLVEAFKMLNGRFKRDDAHYGMFSMGNCDRRIIKKEAEVGVATISGLITGIQWPFLPQYLYVAIQEYQLQPALYDLVQYSNSSKWDYTFTIERDKGATISSSLFKDQQLD